MTNVDYKVGNFSQTTGQSNQSGWGDIKNSQPIPATWDDHSYGNNACPSFFFNGCMIYVASPDPAEREEGLNQSRYTVCTVDQDYDHVGVYDIRDNPIGEQEFDDFADVVKFVEGYNDRYRVQRMLAYLGRDSLTQVHQRPQGNPNATSDDFIDSDFVRSCIAHFNELLNASADIVLGMLQFNEPFSVDDRYCNHLGINEPVLVCSTPEWTHGAICEYTGDVDLAFGHSNPYAADDFDHASFETVAEDLNNAFRYYWETLMKEANEDMFKRFQDSCKFVTAHYDGDQEGLECAYTYSNTFDEGMNLCDASHIMIWTGKELSPTFNLIIGTRAIVSNDLEYVERELFDYIQNQA